MIKYVLNLIVVVLFCGLLCGITQAAFVHPGCLSTQADLNRIAAKVTAGEQPWKGSWDILVNNTNGWAGHTPEAVSTVVAGSCSLGGDNYIRLARDCARAYQLALRYHGDGSTWAANKAIEIMNTWASTHTEWCGDTNISLRTGIYGYQFACAGELLRDYPGWNSADFASFQQYMLDIFYGGNVYFLYGKHGTMPMHYWSNWTQSNVASMMAIGILCDRQDIFDEAIAFYLADPDYGSVTGVVPNAGPGTEFIENSVTFRHPNGFGQWQESGRDQGHSLMGPQLTGPICEMAWNQGIDLYGYNDNLFLSAVECISKYNTWQDVPFTTYVYIHKHTYDTAYWVQKNISSSGRGAGRPGWDLVYNHYVNRLGQAAPYTGDYAENMRPEGGGFNYGGTSGGFDGLGFTTLTHSRDPITSGAAPSNLLPYIEGRQITLSWAGSAYAESYNVKRSTASGGPYTPIAVVGNKNLFYVDAGLTADTTYYYVVSANTPSGETANSAEAAVTATQELHGTVIGTDGSWNNSGADKYCVFDDSTNSYFDPPSGTSGGWAGLDLGSGVSAVITGVKYAPRENGWGSRMVGTQIQGSNNGSTWTTLHTISTAPPENVLTYAAISSGTSYRYFRVAQGSSSWLNLGEMEFYGNYNSTPSVPSAPLAPTVTGNIGLVDVSWTAVSGADSYDIKRTTSSGGPYVILDNVTDTTFSDKSLPYGATTYYYVVSALNSAGESANSNEDSIFLPPVNLTAAGNDGVVILDWDDTAPGSNLDSYNVYRSTTSGSGYLQIASDVVSNAYMDNIVTNGTAYYYVVTATDTSSNESGYSNEAWAIPSGVLYQESGGILSMEAENGVIGSRWLTGSDAGASNGAYIEVDPLYNWTDSSPEGTTAEYLAVYNFNISTSDDYRFWFRMYSDNDSDDSFFWRIDDGNWILENDRYGIGSWFSKDNTQVDSLSTGSHVLEIAYRENGTRLDKFVVQLDSLTVPSGDGPVESSQNTAPSFPTDPINNSNGIELTDYTGTSLVAYAFDAQGVGTLIYSKDSGPNWLVVAPDGTLSGIPSHQNVGANTFVVRVTDDGGLYDTADMTIQVANVYSGTQGLTDLVGFAAQWLSMDCVDIPACDGADLDGDDDVTLSDFSVLAYYWLADESLQLSLKFDEMAGDTAEDDSIYMRTASLVNTPTWTFGHSGGALSFDGVDDSVTVPGYKGPTGSAARTCCAWIKTTHTSTQDVISWGELATGRKWEFGLMSNVLSVRVQGGNIYGSTVLTDDTWHHIALVWEPGTDGLLSHAILYVDGVEETVGGLTDIALDTGSEQDVRIGCFDEGNYFQGLIDDVRIYDRALTADEITTIAQ